MLGAGDLETVLLEKEEGGVWFEADRVGGRGRRRGFWVKNGVGVRGCRLLEMMWSEALCGWMLVVLRDVVDGGRGTGDIVSGLG